MRTGSYKAMSSLPQLIGRGEFARRLLKGSGIVQLKRYVVPQIYVEYLKKLLYGERSLVPPNFIVDKIIRPVCLDELRKLSGVEVADLDFDSACLYQWVKRYFPEWRDRLGDLRHKKLVEFFTTFTLLAPGADDAFMDAAGGYDTYLPKLSCKAKYVQDIRISRELRARLDNKVEYIESDARNISLPDQSVDKISCHHAFEHFQDDSDIWFVKEIQRLLRPKGKCCIVPILISDCYAEITNAFTFDLKFDPRSKLLIDPTAAIPGGDQSGHYARVYDLVGFQERVIGNIDFTRFKATITELRLDGRPVPDLKLRCHKRVTAINRPYRALLIERFR